MLKPSLLMAREAYSRLLKITQCKPLSSKESYTEVYNNAPKIGCW